MLDPQKKIPEERMNRELSKLSKGGLPVLGVPLVDVGGDLLYLGRTTLPKETLRTIAEYMVLRDDYRYVLEVVQSSIALRYLSPSGKSKMV